MLPFAHAEHAFHPFCWSMLLTVVACAMPARIKNKKAIRGNSRGVKSLLLIGGYQGSGRLDEEATVLGHLLTLNQGKTLVIDLA